MQNKILSICIPVYNRESELRDCLISIEKNYVDGIEVVISDNKSTDNTIDVIKEFEKKIPIIWMSKEFHSGFDENCINVISMSSGEYCWILGSDDNVIDGAIELLVSNIKKNKCDIMHFAYVQNGIDVCPVNKNLGGELLIIDYAEKVRYISELKNLSLAFMFISCIAFKRDKWMENAILINESIGTSYVHAFVMHSIINSKSSIYATNKVFVNARLSQNEWTVEVGKFLFLDCSAVMDIHKKINFEVSYFNALCKVFKRSYPIFILFKILVAGGGGFFIKSKKYLHKMGYNWLAFISINILLNLGFIKILFHINKFKKSLF